MQPSKYKVLEELGAGGMGKVYKGVVIGQSGFQRPIVVKQLRQSDDAAHLRDYLVKGGFLWVDDFWGERAWYIWETDREHERHRSVFGSQARRDLFDNPPPPG